MMCCITLSTKNHKITGLSPPIRQSICYLLAYLHATVWAHFRHLNKSLGKNVPPHPAPPPLKRVLYLYAHNSILGIHRTEIQDES